MISQVSVAAAVLILSATWSFASPQPRQTTKEYTGPIQQPDHLDQILGHEHNNYSLSGPAAQRLAASSLQVDLGYAIYQGFTDGSGLSAWQGVRYAASTAGNNRWRAPQTPATNRAQVINATGIPYKCPNAPSSPPPDNPGYNFYNTNEDCLFLSVYAPPNAANLPVFFYIHGGGYGQGDGGENVTDFVKTNGNSIVSVVIQYRLGAFGFLSSTAVHNNGQPNAGLLDQHFALNWTQQYISKFGGDPSRVTIAGQSAGGGSVEMQALAYGGLDGTQNFHYGISASPYTPVTYNYSDAFPERNYLNFSKQAGCYSGTVTGTPNTDQTILSCLRNASSDALQHANYNVSSGINYGSWAFVPVVDGAFIQQRSSQQLASGKVNGVRILTGHNSNEGSQFVMPNIQTAADFNSWLLSEYPKLTDDDINQINTVYYPYKNQGSTPYATCGDCANGATAVNVGTYATGHQQRAIEFYGEATIDCPSLWLAAAYQYPKEGGYKYSFSLPPGQHGLDLVAESFIGDPFPNPFAGQIGPDLRAAMTTSFGNFIKTGNPSISNLLANGNSTGNMSTNAASNWPVYTTGGTGSYQMININQTSINQPFINNIGQVNASNWEGGLVARCNFLKKISADIPF